MMVALCDRLALWQIMTGENWNDVLFEGVNAVGWGSSFFFMAVFALGNTIMLNLFLAVLIDSFTENKSRIEATGLQSPKTKEGGVEGDQVRVIKRASIATKVESPLTNLRHFVTRKNHRSISRIYIVSPHCGDTLLCW